MSELPKISILTPVYNAGKYLRRFIESVLQMSFQDYELILVENWSTDNSYEILQEYQREFPDKIFVYRTEEHSAVGRGRNIAFQQSRGEYVFWCDSDDIIHPYGLERLYREAKENNADLAAGWAYFVYEDNDDRILTIKKQGSKNTQTVSNQSAIVSGAEFWLRLIRRDLVEKVGPMREDLTFDDVSYLPIIHSYASKVRFVNVPVYFYFRRGTSTCTRLLPQISLDSIEAEKNALEFSDAKYIEYTERMVATRIIGNFKLRWQFIDIFVKWAKEMLPRLEKNSLMNRDPKGMRTIRGMARLSDRGTEPNVFVPGFGVAPTEERLEEMRTQVFHEGANVFVLSENTCDISENEYVKAAYDIGRMDIVNSYFALKGLYEKGGVYIHPGVRILNYFNLYKLYSTYFALQDNETYSDRVFGSFKGSPVIKSLLDTFSFERDPNRRFRPLSYRIASVLMIEYDIPLDGKDRPFGDLISVIAPEFCVLDNRYGDSEKRICFELDFSEFAGNDEYVTLKRDSLKCLLNTNSALAYNAGANKTKSDFYRQQNAADTAADIQKYKHAYEEYEAMKCTNTYKFMMKLRKLGDSRIGPFLKKIFHGLIKIKSKLQKH